MLPETQRGRPAESAHAGRGNLQTQTQGRWVRSCRKVPRVCALGADEAGTEPWCPGPPYLSSERGTGEERSPGHGAHRTLVPTVGLGCPRPPFLPLTLAEEGRHANRGPPRARPAHLSALMLELSSQPRLRGWRGVPSWEPLEEAPAKTTQVPAHGSLHSDRTHCWVSPGAQALPPAQLLEGVMLPE